MRVGKYYIWYVNVRIRAFSTCTLSDKYFQHLCAKVIEQFYGYSIVFNQLTSVIALPTPTSSRSIFIFTFLCIYFLMLQHEQHCEQRTFLTSTQSDRSFLQLFSGPLIVSQRDTQPLVIVSQIFIVLIQLTIEICAVCTIKTSTLNSCAPLDTLLTVRLTV